MNYEIFVISLIIVNVLCLLLFVSNFEKELRCLICDNWLDVKFNLFHYYLVLGHKDCLNFPVQSLILLCCMKH